MDTTSGCDLGELLGVSDPPPPVTDLGGTVLDLGVVWSDAYGDDPYTVALAAKQTPCFGRYCPREETCSTCPISKYCRAALRTWIAAHGARLQEKDESQRVKSTLVSAPKKTISSEDDIDSIIAELEDGALAKSPPNLPKLPQEMEVMASVDSTCWSCKKPIPEAEIALFSPGTGLRHRICFQESPPA
jgi:hypothetical protein